MIHSLKDRQLIIRWLGFYIKNLSKVYQSEFMSMYVPPFEIKPALFKYSQQQICQLHNHSCVSDH